MDDKYNNLLTVVEVSKCLGLILQSDLKWTSNTRHMVQKAYHRMWMIKRLKNLGDNLTDLKDVLEKQVRSCLEFGVPVWQSGITEMEKRDIERVQKSFCKIALGEKYQSYSEALESLHLESLESRRIDLCLKFAIKAERSEKFKYWFKPNLKTNVTRLKPTKYVPVHANHARFERSPLSYLTDLLNDYYS